MKPDSLQLSSGQNAPDAQNIAQQLEEKLLSQNEVRDAKAVVKRYPEGVYVHLGLVFAENANIPAAVAQSDKLVREEIEGRLKLKVLDIRSASQIEACSSTKAVSYAVGLHQTQRVSKTDFF
jgi:uncharacterized alkaline shock family protein YloU